MWKFTQSPDIDFSPDKWWNGRYWDAKNKYLNDAVGLRSVMIDVNNQINLSAFGKYSANIAVGKDDYLFFWSFIRVYPGLDYIGRRRINISVRKLKAVQDTLAKMGKSLILVQAPCKAFFYPEYLPSAYQNPTHKPTNYSDYVALADSYCINQVDFNAWFMSIKNKSKDLLFTKQGIHWSAYGATISADSLVRYIEKLRYIKMPHPVWTNVVHTSIPRYSDNDITQVLNLIFPYTHETFSYPEISYPKSASMVRPKVIYIGDSFLTLWTVLGFMNNTNSDWRFWYYFRSVRDRYDPDEEGKEQRKLQNDEWINGINYADCIVLMYTASNLNNLGSGFIEKAYDHYYPSTPIE